jgi:hypothetical protein
MITPSIAPKPIFLFSLPRTGSTLLQRILAAHRDVATANEPHVLLHFLYSSKEQDLYSTYGHQYVAMAIQDFACALPGGTDDFLGEIREFVLRLYAKAAGGDVRYFLDKTPRYSMVIEDIIQLFPEAKIIFLWRNPLSVVSSLTEAWQHGAWDMYRNEYHLFLGLANLIAAYQKYGSRACAVRYEDLVLNPKDTLQRVFAYLEIPFDSEVLADFSQVKLKGRLGDPHRALGEFQVLRRDLLDAWKSGLANPLRKAWCRRYLRWIGSERLAVMGYDLEALIGELGAVPFSLHLFGADLYKMLYGKFYVWLEGRITKHKVQAWRAGQRIYVHE